MIWQNWKRAFTAMALGVVAILPLTTWNANGSTDARAAENPLMAGSRTPPSVLSILARACQDCHSANTHWPWYAKIPPVSWKVHKDVTKGRAFMDLSKWNDYTDSQRKGYLAAIVTATQTRAMPPADYLRIHRDARLSKSDLRSLRAWALAERKLMSDAR